MDWQLLVDNKLTIDLKDEVCNIKNDELMFKEKDIINIINLKKNTYERQAKDYTMYLDFNNKICTFRFPSNEECCFDINGAIIKEKNSIIIKYSYDDEIKEIHILLKEELI